MCTRLVKSMRIRERRVMFFDRRLPFELVIQFRRATPKEEYGVGISTGGNALVVPSTSFTKNKAWRYESRQAAERVMRSIQDGGFCFRCKSKASACNKSIFRKWD